MKSSLGLIILSFALVSCGNEKETVVSKNSADVNAGVEKGSAPIDLSAVVDHCDSMDCEDRDQIPADIREVPAVALVEGSSPEFSCAGVYENRTDGELSFMPNGSAVSHNLKNNTRAVLKLYPGTRVVEGDLNFDEQGRVTNFEEVLKHKEGSPEGTVTLAGVFRNKEGTLQMLVQSGVFSSDCSTFTMNGMTFYRK